jgi:hypothetical protein
MTWAFRLLPFTIPIVLYIASSQIGPLINSDSAIGFLVLRSMHEGAGFNVMLSPDEANISLDTGHFVTNWSPGQYLIPGILISMGMTYGSAMLLIMLFSAWIGLAGWARIATETGASPLVVFLFITGLAAFQFSTSGEPGPGGLSGGLLTYQGGEALLFAAGPWSLLAMLKCVDARASIAFVVTLLIAVLLFVMKLSGLVVFAAIVLGLSATDIVRRRHVSSSILAMWIAAAIAALLFDTLWLSRGHVPASGMQFALTSNLVFFPVAASAFSGVSGIDLAARIMSHDPHDLPREIYVFLALLGVAISGWIWLRLRHTNYKTWAFLFFAIIAIYTALFIAMYVKGSGKVEGPDFEERYLRFSGILFLLLFLLAAASEASHWRLIACFVVAFFAVYGLYDYVLTAYDVHQRNNFDAVSGMTQGGVSPGALQYLRHEQSVRLFDRPIVVVDPFEAPLALPGYRVIPDFHDMTQVKWLGRASIVYILVPESKLDMVPELLAAFADYNRSEWKQKDIDGMVIFSQ